MRSSAGVIVAPFLGKTEEEDRHVKLFRDVESIAIIAMPNTPT